MILKRLIVLVLALMLLCGCAAPAAPNTAEDLPAANETGHAPLVALYEADSVVEQQTDGAVRAYPLGDGVYTRIIPFGGRIMVMSDDGSITLLQGDNGEIVATVATDMGMSWGTNDLCAGKQSVGYYAAGTQEVVVLDEQLREAYRVKLPADIQGKPIIQLDRGEIFYCTAGEVRAVNIQTGLSRLVRSHDCTSQELLGSYFDDTVVACLVVDEQGNQRILYMDSETGRQLDEEKLFHELYTLGNRYYTVHPEGEVERIWFGIKGEETMSLDVPAENMLPLLSMDGALRCTSGEKETELEFYSLSVGRRMAAVTIPGIEPVEEVVSGEQYIWLLAGKTLYRWDIRMSPVQDNALYTSELFTLEAPDTEGLAACQARAEELEQTYYFTLEIYTNAAEKVTGHVVETEFQVSTINSMLDEIEAVLQAVPKDFLTVTGDVRVYLVRSLENGEDRAVYWANGACHVILTNSNVTDAFLWGLGNAVDTRVLGNSFDYDTWEDLNPWWFDYTYDYEENRKRSNPEEFLEGDDRAFADLVSMSYPTEDRSRIFACAMQEGNEALFASNTMQSKLRTICIAIREAYLWEDSTEVFAWEQYLKKPIAATE